MVRSFGLLLREWKRNFKFMESLKSRVLPDVQTKLDRLPLRIQESLAKSTVLEGVRPPAKIPNLSFAKSVMSTNLIDMVLMISGYKMKQRFTFSQDHDARKFQLALAQKPNLLRTVCDRARGPEFDTELISRRMARNRITQDLRKGRCAKQRYHSNHHVFQKLLTRCILQIRCVQCCYHLSFGTKH